MGIRHTDKTHHGRSIYYSLRLTAHLEERRRQHERGARRQEARHDLLLSTLVPAMPWLHTRACGEVLSEGRGQRNRRCIRVERPRPSCLRRILRKYAVASSALLRARCKAEAG